MAATAERRASRKSVGGGKLTRRRKSFGKAIELRRRVGGRRALRTAPATLGIAWLGLSSATRTSTGKNGPPASGSSRPRTGTRVVVTGKDGKARVSFKAPSALSEYRITARGVTGADTLAGQTTATLTVSKSFFVDLKVPASLTQGDKPRFVAQVHHTGVTGKLALRLTVYTGGREDVFPKTIELSKDGVDEVVFDPFEVPEGEIVRLTLKGTIGGTSDEMTVEVPIRPWGVEVVASESGTGSESTTVFVGLPPGDPTRTRRC